MRDAVKFSLPLLIFKLVAEKLMLEFQMMLSIPSFNLLGFDSHCFDALLLGAYTFTNALSIWCLNAFIVI